MILGVTKRGRVVVYPTDQWIDLDPQTGPLKVDLNRDLILIIEIAVSKKTGRALLELMSVQKNGLSLRNLEQEIKNKLSIREQSTIREMCTD